MNANPISASATLCLMSMAVLCLGCRLPHDLVGPIHRSANASQHQKKSSLQPGDTRNSEAAMRPNATKLMVAEAEGNLEKNSLAQPSPNAWSATDFELSPLATEPAANISTPNNQDATPSSTIPPTAGLADATLALAGYSHASPTSIPDAAMPKTNLPQAVANPPMKPTANTTQTNVELQIENVRPKRGKIKVAVFTDAENFLNPSFVAQAFELKDDTTTASTSLSIDKPCAIAVFQDLDGDGQLTKNRLGIPVEPCAFSNNAVIKRGPPKFSEAKVQPAEGTASPTRTSIRLP